MVGGWVGMTSLELGDMLSVSLPVGGKSPLLNGVDNVSDLALGQYRRGYTLDVANEPAVHHVLRHRGLEGAVADKEDDGVKLVV